MKKLLCAVLVLIIAMSFMLTASAADAESSLISFPTLNEAFIALSDFMKLDAIMGFVNAFHDAMSGFYAQFDVMLRGVRVVVNGLLGGAFAG